MFDKFEARVKEAIEKGYLRIAQAMLNEMVWIAGAEPTEDQLNRIKALKQEIAE